MAGAATLPTDGSEGGSIQEADVSFSGMAAAVPWVASESIDGWPAVSTLDSTDSEAIAQVATEGLQSPTADLFCGRSSAGYIQQLT